MPVNYFYFKGAAQLRYFAIASRNLPHEPQKREIRLHHANKNVRNVFLVLRNINKVFSNSKRNFSFLEKRFIVNVKLWHFHFEI